MLFIMAGATLSATGSFKGSVDVPQGLNFVIGDAMKPKGVLSIALDVFNTEVHVYCETQRCYETQRGPLYCDHMFSTWSTMTVERSRNFIAIFHFLTLMVKK
uniref:Uncharacterized protein n=1 Tax=Arundo donax TaxID=35708 RepID=A0A0A9HNS6_ARUDO